MIGCYECGEIPGSRDRVIREMVSHKIQASDAARELLDFVDELRSSAVKGKVSSGYVSNTLLGIHARLVRLQAEDDNDLHDIINRAPERVPA